jgi:putative intracellular protease/amidase
VARILFVLTSHDQLGDTGRPTGYHHNEAAHPWRVLTDAGHTVAFASPKGGAAPITGEQPEDPIEQAFKESSGVEDTLRLSDVDPSDYDAVHLPGGHGTMWDFADDPDLARLVADIYERGGAISAVCHGPAGLVNVKLADGEYLVAGKRISCFTDDEERKVGLEDVVPYLLESVLRERGAIHTKAGVFAPHVEVDGRLVTGQNPPSATPMAEALVEVLSELAVTRASVE